MMFLFLAMKMCTLDDVTTWSLLPALLAELIGTFLLVFVGCASCLNGTHVEISLCFGLTVAALAQVTPHSLLNPGFDQIILD